MKSINLVTLRSVLNLRYKSFSLLPVIAFFICITYCPLNAQMAAFSNGFNVFEKVEIIDQGDGAGFSMYTTVWPIHQQYPGPSFQVGLPHTWLHPFETGNEPDPFNNTIEGGLGWWTDTRFATETPKFIMGGVAYNFDSWANGVGAGNSAYRPDGHRDWSEPNGMHGVAQLSPNLLWPPDGLNIEQGANGEIYGYGYHPLPLIDATQQTNGVNFPTGNQSYTLFLNTSNFKGPATFFIPSYWTEWVLDDLSLEGLFHDVRPADKNQSYAIEYPRSPALVGTDDSGQIYARVTPLVFPKTADNRSDVIRDIKVHTKAAKWNAVESWFNGGAVPPTEFQTATSQNILFEVDPLVDGHIATDLSEFDPDFFHYQINYSFAQKINNANQTMAGFQWDNSVVNEVNGTFVMPEFYKLSPTNEWEPVAMSAVPNSTGLLANAPPVTPRNDDVPYLTPMEPDCHLQDPQSPWRSPGPSAGPFTVQLGDGSTLTYYWYRFIDQPSIIHANLPEGMRQNLQDRVEKIHTHWNHTDEYLPAPSSGTLVGLDPGLIVSPPAGMEIGYVPIVTRQEKSTPTSASLIENNTDILVYPNPTNGIVTIESKGVPISSIQLYNAQGQLLRTKEGLFQNNLSLSIDNQVIGIYLLSIIGQDGTISNHRILKSN